MKVEIRHLNSIERPEGDLLEIVEVNIRQGPKEISDIDRLQAQVGSALISQGIRLFGQHAKMKDDQSLFGGYVRNIINGDCIIAR